MVTTKLGYYFITRSLLWSVRLHVRRTLLNAHSTTRPSKQY